LDYINLTIEQEIFVSNQRSWQSSKARRKTKMWSFKRSVTLCATKARPTPQSQRHTHVCIYLYAFPL